MVSMEPQRATQISKVPARRRIGPVFTVLLLAPIISEVLYGGTRLSTIFVLIPEILTWGCGALLIRECVRAWGKGWVSMLSLGVALAVAEEWIIQQTSIAPFVAGPAYGRVWGVNWVYFLWAVGYESVWVVLLPEQLTELLFPDRCNEAWLRRRGLIIASLVFLVGCRGAWYGWTQRARVKIFHMPPYSPPTPYLLTGAATVLSLVLLAYALPGRRDKASRSAPADWAVGTVFCLLGTPWAAFALLGWGAGISGMPSFRVVLAAGIMWTALTLLLAQRWASAQNWGDQHRFATVLGGIVACSVGGFVVFKVGGALRIDWIGKAVFDLAAIVWLVFIGEQVKRRTA